MNAIGKSQGRTKSLLYNAVMRLSQINTQIKFFENQFTTDPERLRNIVDQKRKACMLRSTRVSNAHSPSSYRTARR
jgi:hypothetical protein